MKDASTYPGISIITVCLNAENHMEQLLKSVADQTYPGIEHIIVDGGSTDQTLQIIERYRSKGTVLVSEPDEGLYDAMNKGMKLATGDYLLFLNSDDSLSGPDILEKVMKVGTGCDACYGEVMFVDETGHPMGLRSERTPHKVPQRLDWRSFRRGMVVSHQAFIIRKKLAVPFDMNYTIAADIDWMIRCLRACRMVCNTGLVITWFRTGGLSKKRQRLAWKERFQILGRHYGRIPNLLQHLVIMVRYLVKPRY
jgi:glycosyltransferase involved in cell wall biosynthesis